MKIQLGKIESGQVKIESSKQKRSRRFNVEASQAKIESSQDRVRSRKD